MNFTRKIYPEKQNIKNGNSYGIKASLDIINFRKLWIGQIFSQLADKFYIILMIYLIANHWVAPISQDNETLESIASAIRMPLESQAQYITLLATGIYISKTIPAILIGTIAGGIADILPKRLIMIASSGIRSLICILIPLCTLNGPTWMNLSWGYWCVIIITFIESILTQFFAPAEQAAIPLLVPKENLIAANSIYQATSMAVTIIGFGIGAPIIMFFRSFLLKLNIEGGEFLLLPLCFGVAAIILSSIDIEERVKRVSVKDFGRELVEGIKVLKNHPSVQKAIVNLTLLYSLLAALYVLAINIASNIDQLGATKFGTLLSMTGVGIALGAIPLGQLGHRFKLKRLAFIGLMLITFTLLILGKMQGSLILTLALCTALGVGAALVAIPAQTTIQKDTPEEQLGKVFGLQNNLINISLSLPLVFTGLLVISLGLSSVLWILAGFALFAALKEEPWKRC